MYPFSCDVILITCVAGLTGPLLSPECQKVNELALLWTASLDDDEDPEAKHRGLPLTLSPTGKTASLCCVTNETDVVVSLLLSYSLVNHSNY